MATYGHEGGYAFNEDQRGGHCDEPDIDTYTDAVIEDTVHCRICGGSFVLGCGETVIVGSHTVCCDCAKAAGKAYKQALRESGVCVHGVNVNSTYWCDECEALGAPVRDAYAEGYETALSRDIPDPQHLGHFQTWRYSKSRSRLYG